MYKMRKFRKVPVLAAEVPGATPENLNRPQVFVDSSTPVDELVDVLEGALKHFKNTYAVIRELGKGSGRIQYTIYQITPDDEDEEVTKSGVGSAEAHTKLAKRHLYDDLQTLLIDWGDVGIPDSDQWKDPGEMAVAIRLLCEIPQSETGLAEDEMRILSEAAKILTRQKQRMEE